MPRRKITINQAGKIVGGKLPACQSDCLPFAEPKLFEEVA